MSKTTGGCLCGAIRYHLNAEPVTVAACHCKNCQKQTGTAYSIVAGVPTDSLVIESGEPKSYTVPGTSGMNTERKFCGDCGSPLYTDAKAIEGLLWLKGGTLDDTSTLEVNAEIWCDSKAGWASLDDSLPKFPGNPPVG
ncbi:aldehyde-activating protein [Chromatiales bacterium (ex Bugula neritina AB1)]|nr:aldehyde-activating protein [Chromatiales bacterium (ex Bugula neritina AB1)]